MAQYYLVKDGQRVGPLAIDQLTQYGLTPETLVWTDGMTDWVQASQIPEVAALLAPKPAPAPAPAPQPAPAPAPQPVQQPQPQYQAPQPQYQQPQPQYQQPYPQAAMGNYVATPQLGFMDAVKICLKKYFDFNGRARRSEFWWFYLACYIVNGILGGIFSAITSWGSSKAAELQSQMNGADINELIELSRQAQEANSSYQSSLIIWAILFGIISIAILIPMLSATARRLHDVGKSGHLQWLYLLCGIGVPICLILCIPDGKPEPNKYGESPKYVRQQ